MHPPPVRAVDDGADGELTIASTGATSVTHQDVIIVQYEVEHFHALDDGQNSTMV